MPAFTYGSEVARIYDQYCVYSDDIPFFEQLLASWEGPVLELMAGTGRLSRPLLSSGAALTCCDSSPDMLRVLQDKLRRAEVSAQLVCADVTRLPLDAGSFPNAILPFNGISELLTPLARKEMFREVAGVLAPRGQFVCTLHNRRVRLETIDDSWHLLGEVESTDGTIVRVSIRARWEPAEELVNGRQRIERFVPGQAEPSERHSMSIRFSLPCLTEVVEIARGVGFECVSCYGDYSEGAYDQERSSVVVAVFALGGSTARKERPGPADNAGARACAERLEQRRRGHMNHSGRGVRIG